MASDRKVGLSLFKSWLDKLPEKEKTNFKIEGKSIFCRVSVLFTLSFFHHLIDCF